MSVLGAVILWIVLALVSVVCAIFWFPARRDQTRELAIAMASIYLGFPSIVVLISALRHEWTWSSLVAIVLLNALWMTLGTTFADGFGPALRSTRVASTARPSVLDESRIRVADYHCAVCNSDLGVALSQRDYQSPRYKRVLKCRVCPWAACIGHNRVTKESACPGCGARHLWEEVGAVQA